MVKLNGRLIYKGWFNRPWDLIREDGSVLNLWSSIDELLTSINGKQVDHNREKNSYELFVNEKSEFKFEYIRDELVFMSKADGSAASNVLSYLEDSLIWLSGRLVEIEIEDGKRIKFSADKSEKVFGVYFSNGNSCEIPEGTEKTVCKIGQLDCCIFATMSSSGFECQKFYGFMARELLDRLAKGKIRASRIGSCEVLGRKED